MTRRPVTRALPAAGITAGATLLWLPALWWPVSTLDEAILLVYPQRMQGGSLPYRDFFAAYGPTFWWGLVGWFDVTGLTLTSMRVLGLLLHVLLALGLYHLLKPHGRWLALLASALSILMMFRLGAAPYAWVTTTMLCIWGLALARSRPALAGLLAGLAVGIRPDVALLALLPPLVLLRERRRRWFSGVALGLAPVWLTLLLTPREMFDNILLGRAGRGAGQSLLPIPPLASADRRLLAALLAAVLLLILWAGIVRTREAIALAGLALLALPQAFQRADYTHFVYAGLFSLPLLPFVVTRLLALLPRPPLRPVLLGGGTGVLLFLVAVPEIPRNITDMLVNGNMRAKLVHHDGRSLPEAPVRAQVFGALLPAIDALAHKGQTLFVFDANLSRPAVNEVSLYYYFPHLRQSAFHMEITPGITSQPGSGLVGDVLDADIVVLVETPERDRRSLFPYATGGSDEAGTALRTHFCRQAIIDRYELWTRCP
jgi:hypothetical protein